jgi:hypothetical protein
LEDGVEFHILIRIVKESPDRTKDKRRGVKERRKPGIKTCGGCNGVGCKREDLLSYLKKLPEKWGFPDPRPKTLPR